MSAPLLEELQQIGQEFLDKHRKYREILSGLPLASADAPDNDTVSSIVAEGTFIRYFTMGGSNIEKAFIYFCQGGCALSGTPPVCRLANCDAAIVRDILRAGQRYLDWSDQKMIRDRAVLFFENGHPFRDPVIGKSHVLTDAEKIRNVIAHDSVEASNAYMAVQRNNFRTERTFPFPAGQMLRARARNTTKNWGEEYFDQVAELFSVIVNG